jgi:hypothetical protein
MAKKTKKASKKDLTTSDAFPKHEYAATLPATPEFPFVRTLAWIEPEILAGHQRNVRDRSAVAQNAQRIAVDFLANGYLTPLDANISSELGFSEEKPGRLTGESRINGLLYVKVTRPDLFKRNFPDGKVPYYQVQIDDMLVHLDQLTDHNRQMALSSKLEQRETAWCLLGEGKKRADVIIKMLPMLEARAKGHKKLAQAAALAAELLEKGATMNAKTRRAKEKEVRNLRVQAFQGLFQDIDREQKHAFVKDAIRFQLSGYRPEKGLMADPKWLPANTNITKNDVKELEKAAKDDGSHDKKNPGAKYLAAWKKLVARWENEEETVSAPRSLSSKKLQEEAASKSAGFEAAFLFAAQAAIETDSEGEQIAVSIAGNEEANTSLKATIKAADEALKVVEYAKGDKALSKVWADLVARVEAKREAELAERMEKATA